MAELLGVVASVVGIAGVGIKLSKTLYCAADKQVNASHNINRIATNVTLFSSMLKQFAVVLQDAKSLYSPEALETTQQIVDECESVFNEIANIVVVANAQGNGRDNDPAAPNDKKRRLKVFGKIKWYFEQPRVDVLLSQLEYLKTTLSVLLQTLHLAAVLAQTKEKEQVSEKETQQILEERIHIETLVMARQLTVVILQQFAKAEESGKSAADQGGRISPVGSQPVSESRAPKLLTQEPSTGLSLVRLGEGNLEFLDRAHVQPTEMRLPATQQHSSCPIVDQLLGRMTRLNEVEVQLNERKEEEPEFRGPPFRNIASEPANRTFDMDSLGLKTQQRELVSLHANGVSTFPTDPGNLAGRSLSPIPPPPGPPRSPSSVPPSGKPNAVDTPAAGERSLQNQPQPALSPGMNMQSTTILPFRSPSQSSVLQVPNSPTSSAAWQATTPRTSSTMEWYTQSAEPQLRSAKPFGSRNSSPGPATPTSDEEDDSRMHRIGLGIPWRIRIGANKYFDFLDARLVGPRTPYLPSEPMSWIYSHDNAHTEISSSWVCEEAIAQRHYAYCETAASEDLGGNDHNPFNGEHGKAGEDETRWSIMCALKFNEIEALVDRTVDIYRQKNAANRAPQVQQFPRAQAPVAFPQPGFPPHPQPNRSVSYSGPLPRAVRPEWERPPLLSDRGVHWAPSPVPSAPGPSQSYYSVSPGSGAPPYSASATAPRSYRDGDWGEWTRDSSGRYDTERVGDRTYRSDRDLDRDRPPSRGKAKDGKKASEYQSKDKKKKSSSGSMAGTLARIGGLAALLEGLDNI